MQPHIGNLINAVSLMAMGAWGYFEKNAPTALIPVFVGILLLVFNNHIRNHNKNIAHIAVMLTLLMVIMLIAMPLQRQLADQDTMGIMRTVVMILTGIFAIFTFVKSFRDARIARERTQQYQQNKNL